VASGLVDLSGLCQGAQSAIQSFTVRYRGMSPSSSSAGMDSKVDSMNIDVTLPSIPDDDDGAELPSGRVGPRRRRGWR
jgi:hypothetical protein